MKILIVGAGAVGGYLGVQLIRAGRSVDFLVRKQARDRLLRDGVEIIDACGARSQTSAQAITATELDRPYDIVLIAVRSNALDAAMRDIAAAVGERTVLIPVINGVAHIRALADRFGPTHVYGGVAQLAVSFENTAIREIRAGADLQIGSLDGLQGERVIAVAEELSAGLLATTASTTIGDALWTKFCFITATATLTCLLRAVIGPIAQTTEGQATAKAVLVEIGTVASAAGHAASEDSRHNLLKTLTDPHSRFAPSMFRDLSANRIVESAVLAEFCSLGDELGVQVPLVSAALAATQVHNTQVVATRAAT